MRILAVDLGKARTGLAVCDEDEVLASPVRAIAERNWDRLADMVAEEAKALSAGRIVVGLPRNMDGSEGESAQNARAFAEHLKTLSVLPVVLWDERGTTITAHGYLNDTDTRGKKRKAVIDAVAATVILQDYLSYRRNRQKNGRLS
ncbi:Holliday junction resolvase RuvX [Caproiciproducens sp. NJN-50]|uniref:Holliday junction resolvase RuvX n=1 Tax=Acutalibacteraceae TaxID=3082771 RepID=UPI000FFE1656|nr:MULTISPECIES: Holliday junction resolvase RuvX [Acutalibacteraceae]QAT50812.1 Holliday junction resolvase RuvX [Caproiciproducens sp. NJN-50]